LVDQISLSAHQAFKQSFLISVLDGTANDMDVEFVRWFVDNRLAMPRNRLQWLVLMVPAVESERIRFFTNLCVGR
jgi:hypothetical protein